MKMNERFRRVLCLVLAAVLLTGFALPAAAVGADPEIRFELEQIDNSAVTAEPLNKMGNATEPAAQAADMDEMVRVTIHLEKEPTIGAGFGLKGIGTNVSAMSYRQSLHREQEKLQKTIERRVLSGCKPDLRQCAPLGHRRDRQARRCQVCGRGAPLCPRRGQHRRHLLP